MAETDAEGIDCARIGAVVIQSAQRTPNRKGFGPNGSQHTIDGLESPQRRCCNWRSGARRDRPRHKEVPHVRQLQATCAPPSPAATTPSLPLTQLWERLGPGQRQELCQVLSLLVARPLQPPPAKEVKHESR
jgi:hypothetical protein